jgi:AsmA protein
MKRFLKWFFSILFILVILVIGTAFALPYIIDPNEYKAEIISQIKPHLRGRDLQIPGDIKLSVIPWLGVEVGEVVIGNAEGFVLKPFMVIKNSKAHVRLLSLLSDKPEIGSLEFRDVTVNLQQDTEGRNNWSDLMASNEPGSALKLAQHQGLIKVSNKAGQADTKNTFTMPSLKVEGLHFYNVFVEFINKKNNDTITLSKLNLDAGPIDDLNPVPLKGKFNFHSKKTEIAAASAFATTMVMVPSLDDFSFKQFILNTNVSGKAVNNNVVKTSLKVPDLNIQTKQEKITAKPLYLNLDDMKSEGRLTITKYSTKPVIRFGLKMDKLSLDKFIPEPSPEGQQAEKQSTVKKDGKKAGAAEAGSDIPTVDDLIGDKPVPVEDADNIFAPLLVLKDTDMQGTLNIGELRAKKLLMSKVNINLQARSGLISALPIASLYGGTYEGNVQVQVKKPSLVSTKHVFRDVEMGPLTLALYGKESLTGRANLQGQFFSTGNNMEEINTNLNGDGQFNVRDARVKTLDVKQLILKKNYDKLSFLQEKDEDKQVTVFNTMRGTVRVKNGIAYNKDFSAISRRVHLKGAGTANLINQTMNYTLTVIPKKSFAFSMAGRQIDLKNKRINTHITGPISDPKIDNELEEVLKAEFKQTELYKKKRAKEETIKQELKEEKEKLEEELKGKLDEILRGK